LLPVNGDKADDNLDLDQCPTGRQYSNLQTVGNNIPYAAMVVLGTAIMAAAFQNIVTAQIAALFYLFYGIAGAIWIIVFICPYCRYWGTNSCPCGYGLIAAAIRKRKALYKFSEQFKKHIPVIVPLWFIPVAAGAYALARGFSWLMLALLVLFALDAFAVLPLYSRSHGCAECPQKDDCPWMGGQKQVTFPTES